MYSADRENKIEKSFLEEIIRQKDLLLEKIGANSDEISDLDLVRLLDDSLYLLSSSIPRRIVREYLLQQSNSLFKSTDLNNIHYSEYSALVDEFLNRTQDNTTQTMLRGLLGALNERRIVKLFKQRVNVAHRIGALSVGQQELTETDGKTPQKKDTLSEDAKGPVRELGHSERGATRGVAALLSSMLFLAFVGCSRNDDAKSPNEAQTPINAGVIKTQQEVEVDQRARTRVIELLLLVESEDPKGQALGFSELGQMGSQAKEILPKLHSLLRTGKAASSWNAAWAIGQITDGDDKDIQELSQALSNQIPRVKTLSVLALGYIGPSAKRALPSLKKLLSDPAVAYVTQLAIQCIEKDDPAAKEQITRRMHAEDPFVRFLQEKEEEMQNRRSWERDFFKKGGGVCMCSFA